MRMHCKYELIINLSSLDHKPRNKNDIYSKICDLSTTNTGNESYSPLKHSPLFGEPAPLCPNLAMGILSRLPSANVRVSAGKCLVGTQRVSANESPSATSSR